MSSLRLALKLSMMDDGEAEQYLNEKNKKRKERSDSDASIGSASKGGKVKLLRVEDEQTGCESFLSPISEHEGGVSASSGRRSRSHSELKDAGKDKEEETGHLSPPPSSGRNARDGKARATKHQDEGASKKTNGDDSKKKRPTQDKLNPPANATGDSAPPAAAAASSTSSSSSSNSDSSISISGSYAGGAAVGSGRKANREKPLTSESREISSQKKRKRASDATLEDLDKGKNKEKDAEKLKHAESESTVGLKIDVRSKAEKAEETAKGREKSKAKEKQQKAEADANATSTPRLKKRSAVPSTDDVVEEEAEMVGTPIAAADAATPRYQSKRAAAEVAKDRISNKTPREEPPMIGSPREKNLGKSSVKKKASLTVPHFAVPERQWAMCDTCQKWRQLPYFVAAESLPEKWFCRLNRWDSKHNFCEAPEETGNEPCEPDILAHEAKWEASQVVKVGRPGRKPGRKPLVHESDDEADGRKSSSPRGGAAAVPVPAVLVQVDWVECTKCKRWRKVPSDIAKTLPDVWYCTMNNWNPLTNKCSVKEETDETPFFPIIGLGSEVTHAIAPVKPKGQPGRKAAVPPPGSGAPVKKVTQWVQCERRNCKKWRKVPMHVNMKTMPEKWYCEMNTWDLDRASCDAGEDTDSEAEGQSNKSGRSQLILSNSKGPGSLSYRRIIFGADGRLRPVYSEKSRNGYGLFSFTETNKSADNDEYMEPTRRIGFWWSGAYDESGMRYFTVSKRDPIGKKKEASLASAGTSADANPSSSTSSAPSPALAKMNAALESDWRNEQIPHLLATACRMAGMPAPVPAIKTKKARRRADILHNMSILTRHTLECIVLRSCLLASKDRSMTLSTLVSTIEGGIFHAEELEACRSSMDTRSIRLAIRRMESISEAEVTYSSAGEVIVHILQPQEDLTGEEVSGVNGESWGRPGLPLKLRKACM